MQDAALQDRFIAAGQGHVFRFWDQLSPAERLEVTRELSSLDLDLLTQLLRTNSGIWQLFYFQVDNPLVLICDEEFIGHHLLANSKNVDASRRQRRAPTSGSVMSLTSMVKRV